LAPLRKKPSSTPMANCPVCSARKKGTTEVYLISEGEDRYFFNVDKAKKIVSDGRPPISIPEATLKRIIALNDHAPMHLAHVDVNRPGIMLQRFGGLVLLDGIHRAALCLEQSRTFQAYMLNYEESLACLIRQEIASHDAGSIVRKLRKVMSTAPAFTPVVAELECSAEVLAQVRAALTAEERERFILKAVPQGRNQKQDLRRRGPEEAED